MLDTILLLAIVVLAAMAVGLRHLMAAVVSLAGASAVLALVFYRLGAPYAGVFELTVAAGLVTVLFLAAISLGGPLARTDRAPEPASGWRFARGPVGLGLLGVCLLLAGRAAGQWLHAAPQLAVALTPPDGDPRSLLWVARPLDLGGQAAILLAAVWGIVALVPRAAGQSRAGHDEAGAPADAGGGDAA